MEPIDRRITAAQLMALRGDADATRQICGLLGVEFMAPVLADRTRLEIDQFIASGDAVLASQLIHAASVRSRRVSKLTKHIARVRKTGKVGSRE
jgi:hypothetical protein